ncbi:hypothetical protein NMG60_11018152 [Bertholletia excelsa]
MANPPANVRQDDPTFNPLTDKSDPDLSKPPLNIFVPEEQHQQHNTSAVDSPAGSSRGSGSGRHPIFRGIRSRSGKWVSEIREPRKSTRIWLGTYPTPEMAAAAYDVAALALKGPDTTLNFPDSLLSLPIPASSSATDVRAAAAAAAFARLPKPQVKADEEGSAARESEAPETEAAVCEDFIDEEELFDMPNLLVDMAGGMLVSPPRLKSPSRGDSPENPDGGGESLWSYP